MKNKLVKYLLMIFGVVFVIAYNGFFQATLIKINDITIIKPVWSSYSVMYLYDTNSTATQHNSLIGNKNNYNMKEDSLIVLKFKNNILYNKATIRFIYTKDIQQNSSRNMCTSYEIIKESDKYIIDKVLYKNNILFSIESDRKENIFYFYNQICNK